MSLTADFGGARPILDQLKTAARNGRLHLLFADESGMSTVPNIQRSWSPLGKPHCADASVARKRVNILDALDDAANGLLYSLCETSITRADVVAFIDWLAWQYDGKLTFVVLDNASIHRHIDEEKIRAWLCDHQLLLLEDIRMMTLEQVRKGESPADVIASHGFNRTTIYKWINAAVKAGTEALRSTRATVRPRSLTAAQAQQVFR